MKREILFRGKRINNGEWVYGGPFFIHEEEKYFIVNNCKSLYLTNSDTTFDGIEVDPKTVGQFTGFKDAKGRQIYEGDILGDWVDCDGEMVLSNEVVFFDEALGCWMLDQSVQKDASYATSLYANLNDFNYEVIGNIYENISKS